MADDPTTWDAKVLAALPGGVDASLVRESLRLTPAERLARLQAMVDFVEDARRGHPVSAPPADAPRPRR